MRQLGTARNRAAALPRNVIALSALLLASFFSSFAFAATFKIDAFEVGRCSTASCDPTMNLIFADEFNAGGPPPSAPNFTGGNAATYFVKEGLNKSWMMRAGSESWRESRRRAA